MSNSIALKVLNNILDDSGIPTLDLMTADVNAPDAVVTDPVMGKTFAEVLGEIVWVMTQHTETRAFAVSDIERLVMPAILLRQFHIQYAETTGPAAAAASNEASKKVLQPVAVEIHAMVSDAVAAALDANPTLSLTLQDWRSGTTKRIMLEVSLVGNKTTKT